MSYYMTNIVITPTLYEEKRLEAISYFSRCSKEAALKKFIKRISIKISN